MNWDGYLCVDGTEVINDNRSLAYMQSLMPGSFSVAANPADVNKLACRCVAMDDASPGVTTYTTPANDRAPWWVLAIPASAEFFGFVANRVDVAPITNRPTADVADGGAVIGNFKPKPRVVEVTGWLIASTARGMRYGERWLTEALSGRCGDSTIHLIPTCDTSGAVRATPFLALEHVGLVDGPNFSQADTAPEGLIQYVQLQLLAGWPYLLGDPSRVVNAVAVNGTAESKTLVTTEAWDDEASIVVTLTATVDALSFASGGGYTVELRPLPSNYGCADSGPGMACVSFIVGAMPKGEQLVIDSAAHEVRRFDVSTKQWVTGWDRVSLKGDRAWAWMDLGPCARDCVSVKGNQAGAGATVSVDVVPVKA